jgi:hypothetical protein
MTRGFAVGIYEAIYRLNTYFDGAFDQLSDNFIAGETVRPFFKFLPGSKAG